MYTQSPLLHAARGQFVNISNKIIAIVTGLRKNDRWEGNGVRYALSSYYHHGLEVQYGVRYALGSYHQHGLEVQHGVRYSLGSYHQHGLEVQHGVRYALGSYHQHGLEVQHGCCRMVCAFNVQ